MYRNGFSLIELMVVIAIVAILAAVAVPAYKNYLITSKAGAAAAALKGYVDQSIQYYNTHNEFPSNAQVGIPDIDWNSAVPFISPNIWGTSIYKNDLGANTCKAGGVLGYIVNYDTPEALPLTGANGQQILYIMYDFVDVKGTINTWCSYYEAYFDGNGSETNPGRILIPGCIERTAQNPNLKNEIDAIITNGCL